MSYPLENAIFQWEEGFRRLQESRSDPRAYRVLGRAVVAVENELRKRLGSSFSVAELVATYRDGSVWSLDAALGIGDDDDPPDTAAAVDAAFYLYMREAADYAGGRVRQPQA